MERRINSLKSEENKRELTYWADRYNESNMDFMACENFWDSRAAFFDKGSKKNIEAVKLVEKFKEKQIITSEKSVLDIGAGTGVYAIPMSKISKSVTTIDIAQNMLDIVEEKAKKENLTNVEIKKVNWVDIDLEKYKWEKKFDLVFASMSPAIHDYQTLVKMIDASKGYCYLSAWVKRDFKIEDALFNLVNKSQGKKGVNEDKIYFAFNVLWNLGYHPEVQFQERTRKTTYSIEEAYESYTKKLMIKNKLEESDKKEILKYLEKNSVNGEVVEELNSVVGSLLWKVK